MSKSALGFVLAGMFYLMAGIILGVIMVVAPDKTKLVSIHTHLNVVGFVIFTIFGVGYHILPRFRGRPLYSEGLAWQQFWVANIGMIGFLVTLGLSKYVSTDLKIVEAAFGALLALSIFLFIYNMARTLVPPIKE